MSYTRKLRKLAVTLAILSAVVVAVLAVLPQGSDTMPPPAKVFEPSRHRVVAVFGATGTVGDGLLKAVMNDPDVEKIHVITRRPSPRIEEGAASGRITVTTHTDYLDYSSLGEIFPEVDAVFWAIGTSTRNVSKEKYGVIHVDYPVAFVEAWLTAGKEGDLSFHYVSGSGAKNDSNWHWAREKERAERVLFNLAEATKVRVVSYRPAAVIHTAERAGLGDSLMQFVLGPFKLTVKSTAIGRAMLEVSARGGEVGNGTILENADILMYANGYSNRAASP